MEDSPLIIQINKKAHHGFTGELVFCFQNGVCGQIKEHNFLQYPDNFDLIPFDQLTFIIERWQNSNNFGIIEIPFKLGQVGIPRESQTFSIEKITELCEG